MDPEAGGFPARKSAAKFEGAAAGFVLFLVLREVLLDGLVNDGGKSLAPAARGQLKQFRAMFVSDLDRGSHGESLACMCIQSN